MLAPLLPPELAVLSLLLLARVRAAHVEAELGKTLQYMYEPQEVYSVYDLLP